MNTVVVRTAELEGLALDYAVGIAIGHSMVIRPPIGEENSPVKVWVATGEHGGLVWFSPSTQWAQGGPLIDKHHISIDWNTCNDDDPGYDDEPWMATCGGRLICYGATALIAICRAIVAAKLGDVVQVPVELVNLH